MSMYFGNINNPSRWLLLFNQITSSRNKWRAIAHSGVYHTFFHNDFASYVFKNFSRIRSIPSISLYIPSLMKKLNKMSLGNLFYKSFRTCSKNDDDCYSIKKAFYKLIT